jgi:hypothetical protein
MLNGESILVHQHFSHRAIYGPWHYQFGGGGERQELSFLYKNKKYHWKSKYLSIVLQNWNNVLFVIMINPKGFSKFDLHYFSLKDHLEEISARDFPKQIAIQNIWGKNILNGNNSAVYFLNYRINPDDSNFCNSNTAHIWANIEKRIHSTNIVRNNVDKDFLKEYKIKNIDPYWGEKINEKNK